MYLWKVQIFNSKAKLKTIWQQSCSSHWYDLVKSVEFQSMCKLRILFCIWTTNTPIYYILQLFIYQKIRMIQSQQKQQKNC